MSTNKSFIHDIALRFGVLVLGIVLGWPSSVLAAPAAETAPAAAVADSVDEAGDPRSATEAATKARRADPTPANWHREGELHEQLGNYETAAQAYAGELEALPQDNEAARQAARGDLQRVRDVSRGRVPDEPASTHRGELDARWASPVPKKKAKVKPKIEAEPAADPKDRIVRKWYFWVTVVAIVASAAAVTGIAIQASRDERRDALDLTRSEGLQGPSLFRF